MKIGFCVSLAELEAVLRQRKSSNPCQLDFVDLSGQQLCRLTRQQTQRLAAALRENHLSCEAVHAAFPPAVALIGAHKSERTLADYVSRLVRRCEILACGKIGVGSPASRTLEKDGSEELADRQMVASLQQIAALAGNMQVLLESIHPNECNYICRAAHAAQLVARTGCRNVKMVADIYHYWLSGEQIQTFSAAFWDEVTYLHIADPNGRALLSPETDSEFWKYAVAVMKKARGCGQIAVEASAQHTPSQLSACYGILKLWQREASLC